MRRERRERERATLIKFGRGIEKGKKVTKKKDFFASSVFLAQKKEEEGNGKLLIAMLKIYYGGGEKNFWRLGKNRERERKKRRGDFSSFVNCLHHGRGKREKEKRRIKA